MDVSTEAAACPKCGAPPAKPEKPKQQSNLAGLVVLVFIIGGIVTMCSSDGDKKENSKEAEAGCAKDDLQCQGDQAIAAAGVYCKDPIERLAKYSVRWTDDGAFDSKFSRFRWADKAAGNITMVGDKAEFQNGFGAYTPVTYECDLAADGKTVLDVRVHEGRLPPLSSAPQ
jgi:hypothetical protein